MRVVVCGAGIAGLALANRLADDGHDVTVVEKASGPREQGYMIDFFGPGYDAAEAMGALPRLRKLAHRIDEAVWVDDHGRTRGGLRYDQFASIVGGRLLSLMRPDLEAVLRERLPASVDLRFGASVTAVVDHSDRVEVTLADGTELTADLLVGADGIHSTVRRLVFGPERDFVQHLGFHTAAYTFHDPEIHRATRGRFCLTDTVDRQLGCYGLRDGRVAVFAVHRDDSRELPANPREALRREYASLGWVVPQALAACPEPDRVYYDVVAQSVLPRWSTGRVTLVGDAAYAVSLLAGQGASLGIAGAFVLAERLRRADTVEEGLAEYERTWRPVVAEKQQVARGMVRWFLPHNSAELLVRRLMTKLSRVPGVDRIVGSALAGKPVELVNQLRASANA